MLIKSLVISNFLLILCFNFGKNDDNLHGSKGTCAIFGLDLESRSKLESEPLLKRSDT